MINISKSLFLLALRKWQESLIGDKKIKVCDSKFYIAVADLFLFYILFCGMGRAAFLTVVLFGYLITVSLLQLNLTIQRRSQAHVENFPPSEHICCCIKSLARNILSHKNNKQKDGPPSFEGRYTAFVNLFY